MNPMLQRLRTRYLALSRRERLLALGAAVVLVGGLGDVTLVEPVLRERARLTQGMANDHDAHELLKQRLASSEQPDANTALRTQLAALQAQLTSTDREFDSLQSGLVQPQHMGALLQSLLAEQRGLQLIGLRSLPVTPIGDAKKVAVATPPVASASAPVALVAGDEGWLYRHAVEIRVQGSYADMLSYLQALEQLPRRVRWGELEIDARTYPANVMTVTIYTVSLEKSWWVL